MSLRVNWELTDLIIHFIETQITPCAPVPSLRMFPLHVYLPRDIRIIHWQCYLGQYNENWPTNPLPTHSRCSSICFQSLPCFLAGKHVPLPKAVARQTHCFQNRFCVTDHQIKRQSYIPIVTNNECPEGATREHFTYLHLFWGCQKHRTGSIPYCLPFKVPLPGTWKLSKCTEPRTSRFTA